MQKPRVLPEPVCPRPRMSRPASASGSVAAWIGNGAVMPAAASAAKSGAGTPAAAKETAGAAATARFARRRLPRWADERRSAGRTDKSKTSGVGWPRFRRPPHPWKPARSTAAYDRRAVTAAPQCSWPRRATVNVTWRFRSLASPWPAAARRGTAGENGQQGPSGLDQSRVAGTRVGLRQGAQGRREPAARVRVTPGVGAGEEGGDGRVQFAAVGAGFGLRLGGQRLFGRYRRAGPGKGGHTAARLPVDHGSLPRGVSREVPAEPVGGQDPGHLGPQRRQTQPTAE